MSSNPQETMTSRERIQKTIARQPVDRVPMDFGIHFSTGISMFAYWNLREYLGLPTDHIEMCDCTQCLARVDQDILERFHIDTLLLNPPWPRTRLWNPRGKYRFHVPERFQPELREDGSWVFQSPSQSMRMPAGGFFFDGAWPGFWDMPEEERLALFARRAEYIFKETDKFTLMMGFSAYFDSIDMACDMLTDPDMVKADLGKRLEQQITYFDHVNELMGPYLGAIEVNGDMGTQADAMCSPASFEECCYPFLKRFCAHVHDTSDIKIFLHSCGSVSKLLPFIVDAGVDILNPVQISAANMDPRMLKQKFGGKLAFWGGGCDCQTVLGAKDADAVRENVKELMGVFKPGGGFVFNQVHNIMGNVPPENVVAMFDTAYENAFY